MPEEKIHKIFNSFLAKEDIIHKHSNHKRFSPKNCKKRKKSTDYLRKNAKNMCSKFKEHQGLTFNIIFIIAFYGNDA